MATGTDSSRDLVLEIEGMTCGACTSSVDAAVSSIPGTSRFEISLLAGRASLRLDTSISTEAALLEAIDNRGFDARIISSLAAGSNQNGLLRSTRLNILASGSVDSMQNFERAIQVLGVSATSLSPDGGTLSITYDPSLTAIRDIVDAAERAGLTVVVADINENRAQLESLSRIREVQEWRRAFWLSFCFALPVFLISMVLPMSLKKHRNPLRTAIIPGLYLDDLLCLLLTIPVQFGVGKRFFVSAYKSLRHLSPTMDVLVVFGTSAAFFFSVLTMVLAILFRPHTKPSTVFDTSTMLITFIALGRLLENRAKGATSAALSRLMSLTPEKTVIHSDPLLITKVAERLAARAGAITGSGNAPKTDEDDALLKSSTDNGRTISPALLHEGDVVLLHPSEKVPADGTVLLGSSYVDESLLTGESLPVLKGPGSQVIGGTVNGTGRLDFRVDRTGAETQLSRIVKLVQDAQVRRAPIQRVADRVAGYFVPVVISLGLLTFATWLVLSHVMEHPPAVFIDDSSGGSFVVCLKLCISVIVFACPCALGLSTPTAIMVGTGVGAQHGILIKSGEALEIATRVSVVVFDKTGTLTNGQMVVSHHIVEPESRDTLLRGTNWWTIIALVEMGSEHPVAKALVAYARKQLGLDDSDPLSGFATDFQALPGQGVYAHVDLPDTPSLRVAVGNRELMDHLNISTSFVQKQIPTSTKKLPPTPGAGFSVPDLQSHVLIALDDKVVGVIFLNDAIRPFAPNTVRAVRALGMRAVLVTGDGELAAHAAARVCGIDADDVVHGASPAKKSEIVSSFQASGQTVAMVGDGINDSPALATANLGIALASGTDVAIEAADVVLMSHDSLEDVVNTFELCRAVMRRIKMNLLWATGYNFIGLPFAMGCFLPWGVTLPPMAAGAAMAASSVSVVLSSLSLRTWQAPQREGTSSHEVLFPGHRGGLKSTRERLRSWMRSLLSQKSQVAYTELRDLDP